MDKWQVDFMLEPTGREVSMSVNANSSKQAMLTALAELKMERDELLHTLYAHIGRPVANGP